MSTPIPYLPIQTDQHQAVYMQRKEPSTNCYRFYALQIAPTLFGQWSVVRRWGRIGAKGAKLEQWFDTFSEASGELEKLRVQKGKRGYL